MNRRSLRPLNRVAPRDRFKKNADAVVAECKGNPKTTVMQTVNKMMAKKK